MSCEEEEVHYRRQQVRKAGGELNQGIEKEGSAA